MIREMQSEYGQVDGLLMRVFGASRLGEYERVVCCWEGDLLVGCVGLTNLGGKLCLNQLCVEEAFRGMGVASSMLEFVSRQYPREGLVLYVDKHKGSTDCLVEFYCGRGFQVVSEGPNEFLLGRAAIE